MNPRLLQSLAVLAMLLPAMASFCAPVLAATITGTATYRERVALTRNAMFEATLEDVSKADAPAQVIARVRTENPGQVPIAFDLSYDQRRIDARRRYVVRASIYEDGELRFTNQQTYPVLTYGHVNRVTVLMRRVTGDEGEGRPRPGNALGSLPATFAGMVPCADCAGVRYQINLLPDGAYMQRATYLRDGQDNSFYEVGTWSLSRDGGTLTLDGGREETRWAVDEGNALYKLDRNGAPTEKRLSSQLSRRPEVEPMEPRVQLTGMFRYMVDAPRFRDCRSGLRWPVAMSDDYLALERAYIAQRVAPPGSELQVILNGRIERRAAMEGDNTEPTLVVEKFVRVMPGEKCKERGDTGLELGNTRWRPIRIGDRDVIVTSPQREPWIMLDPSYQRVTGSGGCNRISGSYDAGDGTLRFGRMASTMMACPSMETETAFLRALENTRRYRVQGRALELLDANSRRLARLEERNLR